MRVAVTGGGGFVGAHLVRALAERGDEVTSLDVTDGSPLLAGLPGVRAVRCDVSVPGEVGQVLADAQPELIFHAAGILSASAEERPHAAFQANAIGTYNLLQVAGLLGIHRVVFTSTMATYGPGVARTVDETTPQRPSTMYGVTKVFGELLGEYFSDRTELDFRAIRLPAVMGPGRGHGGASAYGSLVVTEPARGRPYVVPVSRSAVMPLIYVKDAVNALISISQADVSPMRHRSYGVDGFSPTAGELADAVVSAVPSAEIDFEPDADTVAIIESWPERIDGSRAAADWGWAPRYDLVAAVEDCVAELASHPAWP